LEAAATELIPTIGLAEMIGKRRTVLALGRDPVHVAGIIPSSSLIASFPHFCLPFSVSWSITIFFSESPSLFSYWTLLVHVFDIPSDY
jgi:hypothetical protein